MCTCNGCKRQGFHSERAAGVISGKVRVCHGSITTVCTADRAQDEDKLIRQVGSTLGKVMF